MKNYATHGPDTSGAAKGFDNKLSSRDQRTREAHAECRAAIDAYDEWLTADDSTSEGDNAPRTTAPRRRISQPTWHSKTRRYAETFGIDGLLELLPLDQKLDAGDLS
jgi:hypothetical protein